MAIVTWASNVDDIRDSVREWDLFYEANHTTIDQVLKVFRERCLREGYQLHKGSFVFRNKIRPIVDKRAESIPEWFNFDVDSEAPDSLREWLKSWIEGPHFEDGRNLWQVLPDWNLWLERHGNLVLRLAQDSNGDVVVARVPIQNCDVQLDARDILKVLRWKFTWHVAGTDAESGLPASRTIVEELDANTYRRYVGDELEEESTHALGFIPVVHVAINRPEGAFWGRSVIQDLIEPQLWIAAVMTTIREVNRWMGWPIFAGDLPATQVDLRPGGYTVDPNQKLRVLTWSVSPEALFRELEEHLSDLYERGRVARKSPDAITATGNLPSGKALLILTQDGIAYIQRVVSILEETMAELLWKAACMAGVVEYDPDWRPVTVTYPPLKMEDDAVKINKARVIVDAYGRALLPKKQVIQALIDLDIINPEESPEELAAQASEELAGGIAHVLQSNTAQAEGEAGEQS